MTFKSPLFCSVTYLLLSSLAWCVRRREVHLGVHCNLSYPLCKSSPIKHHRPTDAAHAVKKSSSALMTRHVEKPETLGPSGACCEASLASRRVRPIPPFMMPSQRRITTATATLPPSRTPCTPVLKANLISETTSRGGPRSRSAPTDSQITASVESPCDSAGGHGNPLLPLPAHSAAWAHADTVHNAAAAADELRGFLIICATHTSTIIRLVRQPERSDVFRLVQHVTRNSFVVAVICHRRCRREGLEVGGACGLSRSSL